MRSGILHPVVWGFSPNSLGLILWKIDLSRLGSGATGWHMARQCQDSLPRSRHIAAPARGTYLAGADTWWQKHWSYTQRRNFKYHTFLFVDIAEIGTVSVLSSNQNEAYIGCQLRPETLTWPDLANQPRLEFGNNTYGVKRWDCCGRNVIFAMNEAHN